MWYVVQVTTGQEQRVCDLVTRIASKASDQQPGQPGEPDAPADLLKECFVPTYETERKYHGEWQTRRYKLFPGYVIAVTDHVDLLYLHQPVGEVRTAWEAMEEAYAAGKVRALGLSNFSRGQVEEVLSYATVAPQVVTCESHPFTQREGFRRWLVSRGIAMEAWFPLGHGSAELLREPTITDIAMAHGASPAQAILRWHVQRGVSVTPSTSKLEHIKENLQALSLELEEDEMAAIAALDRDEPFYVPTQEVLDGFLTRDLRFEEPREDPWYLR